VSASLAIPFLRIHFNKSSGFSFLGDLAFAVHFRISHRDRLLRQRRNIPQPEHRPGFMFVGIRRAKGARYAVAR
jgi:hypothetical protein